MVDPGVSHLEAADQVHNLSRSGGSDGHGGIDRSQQGCLDAVFFGTLILGRDQLDFVGMEASINLYRDVHVLRAWSYWLGATR